MTEGINTLQEFMFRTKGICYILAFVYLFSFIGFWRFLNQKKNRY